MTLLFEHNEKLIQGVRFNTRALPSRYRNDTLLEFNNGGLMKKFISFLCCLLVVTTSCGGGSSLSSEDQKVVDDVAIAVAASDDFPGTADDAECVAERLVTSLGTAYIRDNNLTDAAAFEEWELFDTELSRDEFKGAAKGMFGCVEGELSTLLGAEDGLEGLSEKSVECFFDAFQDDKFLDAIYDGGEDDDALVAALFTSCPSAFVDGLVAGAGWDREAAECFADELSPELLAFFLEISNLPGDEIPEDSTQELADFLALAAKCDLDLADLG